MFNNKSNKKTTKYNPWGDDHPEKLKQNPPPKKTIGFKNQLKGLMSPDKMFNQVIGARPVESVPQAEQEISRTIRKKEGLIFAFASNKEDREIQKETHQILNELKKQITQMEKEGKEISKDLKKVKVEQIPEKGGVYYLLFFEWLISVVRKLRMKVSEGRTWLKAFTNKQKKKRGYWQMYKKHGTTFGLSHERSVSTQIG